MRKTKKLLGIVFTIVFGAFTLIIGTTAQAAVKKTIVPVVQFASAPVIEYTAGDRVQFNINSPNYGGKVEYRVVLWDDSQKSYSDLWNDKNGYPSHYYTKWQPKGNTIFTLGWPIFKPGSYRITVYAKRVGVESSNAAMKGMNCDSYKQSVAFTVKPKATLLDKEGQTYGSKDLNKPEIYNGDTKITAKNIALNNVRIEGNLYITGDNAAIKNVSAAGKVVVDPGKDGSTTLENVTAKNIEVLSGGQNSIHIKNVQADTMNVNSSTPIRIEADGDTQIVSTSVSGYVIFDRKNGTYGTIKITEGTNGEPVIEFRGDIQDKVEVETAATIKTGEDSKISNLVITTEKATDTVKLEGQYDKVEVAKEAKVEIGETTVITDSLKVTAKSEIKANEKADVNKVDIATTTDETVKLAGTFEKVEINSQAKVEVAADTKIESIVANTNAEINLDKTAVVNNVDKGSNTVSVGGEGQVGTTTSSSTGETSSGGGVYVPPTVAVSSITFSPTTMTLTVGQAGTVTAVIAPDNATNKNVQWHVEDHSNGATTNSNGAAMNVLSTKAGTINITATAAGDTAKTATCVVTVKPIIGTSASIINGTSNPSISVSLVGDTFTAGAADAANWTIDAGTTGLSDPVIALQGAGGTSTGATITFTGSAQAGTISIQPKAAALTGGIATDEVSVVVEAPKEITGAKVISDIIAVTNDGKTLESIKTTLGNTIKLLAGMEEVSVPVTWSLNTEPSYDNATAGNYVLTGTIGQLPSGYVDVADTISTVSVRIVVADAEFAVIGIKADYQPKDGEPKVVDIRINADMKRVTVMNKLTVGGLKSAIESTDGLELNYEVRDLDGNIKADEAVIAQDDTLFVSSQDGLAFGAYMIRVFGTVNIEVVTKQGETTIPVSKPKISLFNENNEPIYFLDGDGNPITETIMGDDGKWTFFINAAKYLYRVKAAGYNIAVGEFTFTLNPDPLSVKVNLSQQKEITGFTALPAVDLNADEYLADLASLKASGKLPTTVTITDGTTQVEADITDWIGDFDGTQTGEKTLTAILTIPVGYADLTDPINVTITVNVNIAQTAVPMISTTSTVADGAVDPAIVVNLADSTFAADGVSTNPANWTANYGTTGLQIGTITRDSDTQVTINLSGKASVGTLTLKAKAAALNNNCDSTTITIMTLIGANGTIVKAEPTTMNGGEKATATVSDKSITFDGEIAYYKDDIMPGNWVGVKITAPTNVIPDENAILTVNGRNCNLNENPGWSNIKEDGDGDNFFYLYQRIRDISKVYQIVVKWNNATTEAYCINFAPTAMLQVYKTDLEDIIKSAQRNYDDTSKDIYYGDVTEKARQALLLAIEAAQTTCNNAVNAKTDAVQASIYTAQDELIAAMDAYWDSYITEVYAVSDNIEANTTYNDTNPLTISIRIEGLGDFVIENTSDFITLGEDLSNMSIKSITPVFNTDGIATGANIELTGTTGNSIDHGTISIAAGGINGHRHGFDVVCNAPVISLVSGIVEGDVDPSIVITLENDAFTADGVSNLLENWTIDYGLTGFTGGTITRDSDTQMTFHLKGTVNAGVLMLKANGAALTRDVDSNTIRITIPKFAAIGIITDYQPKDGEPKVVGIRNDSDMKCVTVMNRLTVGGLKSAIESADGLELNYEVRDLDGNIKDDEAVLAHNDTLFVSAQDGLTFGAYMISVFGTVNVEVVTKQGETTIPVSKPIISMFNENNEPIYFLDDNGNPITETIMGNDGKWKFFINAAKYLYRIKAAGYNTAEGDFTFSLEQDPLTVMVTLSPMNNTITTIRVKDGDTYQQKVSFIDNTAEEKYAIIEYPTTVGELKSSIESTNGSVQIYQVAGKAMDTEILENEDILTITAADGTTKGTYILYVFDTMTFTVTDGTDPIEGAIINIFENGSPFDFNYGSGDPAYDIMTGVDGTCIFNLPCNGNTFAYRITASGCEPQVGSLTPGQPNSDVFLVPLSPMMTNATTICIKQGHETEVAGISDESGTKFVTVVYPLTVGELKSGIESTNGSIQSYIITGKVDTDTLAAGDILTVTSQDGTASDTYTIRIYVTVTIKVVQADGTTPVTEAILNLFEGGNPILIEDGEGNLTPDIALNEQGEVTLWYVPATYSYSIRAEGYNAVNDDFTLEVKDDHSTVTVTLSPVTESKEITDVKTIDNISVVTGNGKTLDQIKADLGNTVTLLADTEEIAVTVTWSTDTNPAYNNSAAGTYVLTGTIGTLPDGYVDEIDTIISLSVDIVVAEAVQFQVTTDSTIVNNEATLGLVGATAVSSDDTVATAEIINIDSTSKIAITSVAAGTAD